MKPASVEDPVDSSEPDPLISASSIAGTFQIVFVGVAIVDDIVIYFAPKYLHGDYSVNDLRQVFAALRCYQMETEDITVSIADEGGSSSRISAILSLIESYLEHGIYTNRGQIYRINGNGQLHWARTISSHVPILQDDRPIYMEYETVANKNVESDFISLLHKTLLTTCSSELEECGLLSIFSLSPLLLSDIPLEDFHETDYILYRIEQEASVQFVTWKQNVLKTMHKLLSDRPSFETSSGLSCYGSGSFHVIWEKACKVAFSDMLDEPISSLPIELSENWASRSDETLLSIIPPPKWRLLDANGEYFDCDPVDTLVPDIVTARKNTNGDKELCIYDAKYYDPIFKKRLHGVPGIESITKQLLYQAAYRDFVLENDFSIVRNAFVIPSMSESMVKIAEVSFDVVPSEGIPFSPYIEVLLCPANEILACYSNQHSFDADTSISFSEKAESVLQR